MAASACLLNPSWAHADMGISVFSLFCSFQSSKGCFHLSNTPISRNCLARTDLWAPFWAYFSRSVQSLQGSSSNLQAYASLTYDRLHDAPHAITCTKHSDQCLAQASVSSTAQMVPDLGHLPLQPDPTICLRHLKKSARTGPMDGCMGCMRV